MGQLLSLLRQFRADERGVFGMIFAVLAIVLIALGGAVVDFVTIEQTRNRAQVALDAAALALQKDIFAVPLNATTIQNKAQALVTERIGDSRIAATLNAPVIDVANGSLYLTAKLTVPTMFVALVGVKSIDANIASEATRKKTVLEVAFVLDNSNSMDASARMTNLIAATKCAANILLNEDCNSTATVSSVKETKLAIVPFTMQVNVGTNNANASWMDRTGSNNVTSDNFDNDDNFNTKFNGPIDRIALFGKMTNASWGGCVEARKTPYDTDDTLPVPAQPGTMFTPLFAPDEPGPATDAGNATPGTVTGGFMNSYLSDTGGTCSMRTCVHTEVKNKCSAKATNSSSYGSASCSSTASTYKYTNPSGVTSTVSSCAATIDSHAGAYTDTYSNTGSNSNYTNTRVRTWTYALTNRELQERLCKYNGATMNKPDQSYAHGPNADCPVNAIQPLTNTKSLISAAIKALDPQGGTNIHAGTEWGFRVLSPSEPFTEGTAYGPDTSKVMIIMTDGENTAYPNGNMNNTSYYSYYGFPWNGRMGSANSNTAQLETEMNARTKTTCENAKKAGITVYTIGLAVDLSRNPAVNTKLLQDCSSGSGFSFFPTKSSDLTQVFTDIANQLAALRIAR